MKKTLVLLSFFIVVTTHLAGCRSTAVKNIEESEFVVNKSVSLTQIKQAIIRACKKARWKVRSSNNNKVIASYSYKRNKFGAVVGINFDYDSYDIIYLSSHNLKYTEHTKREDNPESDSFWDESQEVFSDLNPFKKPDQADTPQQSYTIHKIYNKWVRNLDQKISQELKNIGNHRIVARPSTKKTRSGKVSPKKTTDHCNDHPTSLASGLATISKSAVNIRSGAGIHCSISGSVSRNETFTLLGRKNNWYYISLNQNNNAWIYAPLIKKVSNNQHREVAEPKPPEPPPPLLPTKNISIAVIHFKTLNKEAQEIALGDLISETFTSALVNSKGFKIIEREQLDKVVKEMEMNQTGFIETTDAVEIGKMLHADAIITGSVALLNNQIQLNARIIEIESAYVISAETKTTTYTLQNITKIANEMVQKLSRKLIKSTHK